MPNAMFVSVNVTYPQLSPAGQSQGAAALRNCTCVAWNVNPARAQGIEYLFGVFQHRVVSAYKVTHPVSRWPVIPLPGPNGQALGGGRYCVPVEAVSPQDWATATGWHNIPMFGAVRYGDVQINDSHFSGNTFSPNPPTDDGLVPDGGA